MKTDYETYRFTLAEWIRYPAEGVLLCLGINLLFYQSVPAFFLLLPLTFWYVKSCKMRIIRQRKQRLHYQFKDAMNSISAGIAAGYSLENAVREAAKDLQRIYGKEGEMTTEFVYMAGQMQVSVSIEKLFYDLGRRSGVDDISSFSEILAQTKRMGGNMKETLQECVRIMEDKIDVKREIDTYLAEKRLEQTVMSLMPAGIIGYLRFSSPGFLDVLYHNGAGILVMTICLGIYAGACLWGRKLITIDI